MSLSSLFRKNNKQEIPDNDTSYSRAKDEPNPKRPRAKRKSAAEDETDDPVLPEKKRARRRLIGAVALVLAAVIGLPMVLDSEPRPIAQDIDIKIPSKDHAPAPRRLPQAAALDPAEQIVEPAGNAAEPHVLKPASTATAESGTQKTSVPAQSAKAVPTGTDKTALTEAKTHAKETPAIAPASAGVEKLVAADKPGVAKSDAKVIAKSETSEKDPKADTKSTTGSQRESERAMAILEGKAGAKPASDNKPARYSIQVAALSSQDKVNELRSKLKAAGIASQTQKVPTASGDRIRVRVGPFASKEEAEKMRARLVKMGLNGSLVPQGE